MHWMKCLDDGVWQQSEDSHIHRSNARGRDAKCRRVDNLVRDSTDYLMARFRCGWNALVVICPQAHTISANFFLLQMICFDHNILAFVTR